MNIYEKLIEVRKTVPYLQKENEGQQYKYVSSSQTLATVTAKMNDLGLLLVPSVIGKEVSSSAIEYTDKYGMPKRTITYFTELSMTFTWINAEKPDEKIVCPWYGQGVDIAGEKGVGKAMTYAEKYFLLKFFNIATDKDDPDAFQEKHGDDPKPKDKPAPKPATQPTKPDGATDAQIKRIFATAKEANVSTDDLKKMMDENTGKTSTKELTTKEAAALIDFLTALKGTVIK